MQVYYDVIYGSDIVVLQQKNVQVHCSCIQCIEDEDVLLETTCTLEHNWTLTHLLHLMNNDNKIHKLKKHK